MARPADGQQRAALLPDVLTDSRPLDPRLSVPPLPPRLVSRGRLLDALDQATERGGLTLVTAGPGAGKTVLLSDWAQQRPEPTAWLSLTRADNDPQRFWSLFVRATRSTRTLLLPGGWTGEAVPGLLDALFGEDNDPAAPVMVVLDDAQLLTSPEILDGLDRVVRRWSNRVHLILAARSVPLLPMHAYRLTGRLHELRAADLAMTHGEARQVLVAHGVTLSERGTDLLTARTEGWAAGVRLAALRMEGAPNPDSFVSEMAVNGGSIGEYLIQEVLSVLPEPARRLLVQTSFLDVISAESAAAVTGIAESAEILSDLARTNSFITVVDGARSVFRCHPLLREVLRYLARNEPAEALQQTHRRATEWFRGRGEVDSALRWAIQGGESALARSVLVQGLPTALVHGQDLTQEPLRGLVEHPPCDATPEELEQFETARLVVAALTASTPAEAAAELAGIAPWQVGVDQARSPTGLSHDLAVLLLAQKAERYDLLDRVIEEVLDEGYRAVVAAVAGLRSRILLTRARTRFSAGRPSEVAPMLALALTEAEREEAFAIQLDILSVQAMASASAGRPEHTREALRRADGLLSVHHGLSRPVVLDLARAREAFLRADVPTMAASMDRVLAAGPLYADAGVEASVALSQAILLVAGGMIQQAREWLHAPALNSGMGLLRVYRDCELAWIEISLGRGQRALSYLRPYEGTRYALSAAVTLARAYLATGDVGRAKQQVRSVLTDPSPQVDRYVLVSALLCRAEIAVHEDDSACAIEYVGRARQLAGDDVVMPFVRVAHVFVPLLRRHPSMAAGWPRGSAIPPGVLPPAGLPPNGGLPEPLTERETAVLRLLTTTMSTTEMADQMCLSVNTVKTHLAAIYRKMGVRKRRDAVAHARQLELL